MILPAYLADAVRRLVATFEPRQVSALNRSPDVLLDQRLKPKDSFIANTDQARARLVEIKDYRQYQSNQDGEKS